MKTSFVVYLNLDDEDEKLIHEYLKGRNKNFTVKRLILNEINGVGFEQPKEKSLKEDLKEATKDLFNF